MTQPKRDHILAGARDCHFPDPGLQLWMYHAWWCRWIWPSELSILWPVSAPLRTFAGHVWTATCSIATPWYSTRMPVQPGIRVTVVRWPRSKVNKSDQLYREISRPLHRDSGASINLNVFCGNNHQKTRLMVLSFVGPKFVVTSSTFRLFLVSLIFWNRSGSCSTLLVVGRLPFFISFKAFVINRTPIMAPGQSPLSISISDNTG